MRNHTFTPAMRLLKRPQFRRVFERGRSRGDQRLIVYVCPRLTDEEGDVIPLKVGNTFFEVLPTEDREVEIIVDP